MYLLKFKGILFHSHNRNSMRKGGLDAYIQSDFYVLILDKISFWREGLLESLVMRLCKDGGVISLVVIYRPMSFSIVESLIIIENLCNKLGFFRVPSVLVGDFNFNLL